MTLIDLLRADMACCWLCCVGIGAEIGQKKHKKRQVYLQQQLRLGYYSAVTHSDALFGEVMDAVDGLGLRNSTLVLVTGDHGWQLGEHTQWGKHTVSQNKREKASIALVPMHARTHRPRTSSVVGTARRASRV